MRYTNITSEEMRDFLKLEKGWRESVEGKEIGFTYCLSKYPFIQIKVLSGIKMGDGNSRDVGRDAIRVFAFNSNTKAGWISTQRCYRVEGWKSNLRRVVEDVINQAKARCEKYSQKNSIRA
jgi:hypothetical protein